MISSDRTSNRQVIEALRTGVPTHAAVKVLGGGQPALEERFRLLLEDVSRARSVPHRGFLFNGGFGTGKSHLLETFAARAVSEGFVVSRAVVSKSLSLHNSLPFLVELMSNTEVTQHHDDALLQRVVDVIVEARKDLSGFRAWLRSEAAAGRLAPIYEATVRAAQELRYGSEDLSHITEYWSGANVPAADLNRIVRLLAPHISPARPSAAERPKQTVRFLSRLFTELEYRGWIVILDEVELIRLQGVVSRGKSYAELAWWMGLNAGSIPGLGVVGAVTDDFVGTCIDAANPNGNRDASEVPWRFAQNVNNVHLLVGAQAGMNFLVAMQDFRCKPHNKIELQKMQAVIRTVYEGAFGCTSSVWPVQTMGAAELRSVRTHVRRWITQWDLERQGRSADVEVDAIEARPDDYDEE